MIAASSTADANGWTALICAAAGNVAIVRKLIEAGADINHAAKDGMTALRRAAASGHPALVELFEAEPSCAAPGGLFPVLADRVSARAARNTETRRRT